MKRLVSPCKLFYASPFFIGFWAGGKWTGFIEVPSLTCHSALVGAAVMVILAPVPGYFGSLFQSVEVEKMKKVRLFRFKYVSRIYVHRPMLGCNSSVNVRQNSVIRRTFSGAELIQP